VGQPRKPKILNREDLAGKTGSTNDLVDGWFAGFNSDLVATAWVGFDQPHTTYEHGSELALPIWIDFMKEALVNAPLNSLKRPEEIVTVKIDPASGFLANPEQKNATFEIFASNTAPTTTSPEEPPIIDDPENDGGSDEENGEKDDSGSLF
jgi:penicillin-binding protein 1A